MFRFVQYNSKEYMKTNLLRCTGRFFGVWGAVVIWAASPKSAVLAAGGESGPVSKPSAVEQVKTFRNPIQGFGADPWMIQHDGKYYYAESDGGHRIFVKESKTITKLGRARSRKVMDASVKGSEPRFGICGPHLNLIRGKWYIYFCAQTKPAKMWSAQRMWVLRSTTASPYGPYEDMGEVLDSKDKEWAIDGAVLTRANGDLYFIWSGIKNLKNQHQSIWIARMRSPIRVDRKTITEISRPTFPWECSVRPIQEGPRPLFVDKNGKTIVMYSANASWTDEYCLGSLTNTSGDFLNPAAWEKSRKPLFYKTSTIFGPGGASYVKSPDGTEDWIIYHTARKKGSGWGRVINAQRFTWKKDGTPDFGIPIPRDQPIPVPSGE